MEKKTKKTRLYRESLSKTGEILKRNPLLIFFPLGLGLINTIVSYFFLMFTMTLPLEGLVTALVTSLLTSIFISIYFKNLQRALGLKKNLGAKCFWTLVLINFIFSLINTYFGKYLYLKFLWVLIFLALNPLGEIIYEKGLLGGDLLSFNFSYLRENGPLWLGPNLIILAFGYLKWLIFSPNPLDLFVPIFTYTFGSILATLFLGVFIVFRGVLFFLTTAEEGEGA